jgi:diketogulonate reductase-like aldo/keto reductase
LFLKLCDREELEYPDFALLEIHPLNFNFDLINLYRKNNIKLISYSSLGTAGTNFYESNIDINFYKKKYKLESYTQVLLGYILNKEIIPIAKSSNINHLQQNIDTLKYLKNSKAPQGNYNELDQLNLYTPFNNDTSNSIIGNGQLRI